MAMMKGGMCNCPHHKVFAFVVLLVGILFLLKDLNYWSFWNLNWWTVGFLMLGLKKVAGCKCCAGGHY